MAASSFFVGAAEYHGKINGLYVSQNGLVLLAVDNGISKPDCNDPTWDFTFQLDSPVGQTWMSFILTAKTTGKDIKVGYTPNADSRCGVNYLYQLE